MLLEIIYRHTELYISYILLFIYFYLLGRSSSIIFSKFLSGKVNLKKQIFLNKQNIFYPIFGILLSANLLLFINFFIPLESNFVLFIMFLFLLPNLKHINIDNLFTIQKLCTIQNLFCYVVIPIILLVSTYDILFHYDAGYYHLNNQNWIRESNLIIGMVNIFWASGMSSLYEYVSAVLWFDSIFIYLHFLNLIFIHFLYIFITKNIFNNNNKELRNISILMLLFSFLDNFGLGGGRNGFIYIQGVGKQDTTLAILFFLTCTFIFIYIKKRKISEIDLLYLSILTFSIIAIKLSGVVVFIFYLFFIIFIAKEKIISFKNIIFIHFPVILFGLFWTLKTFLMTGCFIFPLNVTCKNSFDWYVQNSTESYELISKASSLNYEWGSSFTIWVEKFTDYEFYMNVLTNFLISILIFSILKRIMFTAEDNKQKIISLFFIIANIFYLIFFGPIPRYAMGFMMVSISLIGLFTCELKINISKNFRYIFIFISIILLVRINSYNSFFSYSDFSLFDPRVEAKYVQSNQDWVIPDVGDQCWINLNCSMARDDVFIDDSSFFKVAYKN